MEMWLVEVDDTRRIEGQWLAESLLGPIVQSYTRLIAEGTRKSCLTNHDSFGFQLLARVSDQILLLYFPDFSFSHLFISSSKESTGSLTKPSRIFIEFNIFWSC